MSYPIHFAMIGLALFATALVEPAYGWREEKIMHFEIANEGFWTGMGDWAGTGRENVRELARYMNDRTDIPVATTTPAVDGDYCADSQSLNEGVADMATIHSPREGEVGGGLSVSPGIILRAGESLTLSGEPAYFIKGVAF